MVRRCRTLRPERQRHLDVRAGRERAGHEQSEAAGRKAEPELAARVAAHGLGRRVVDGERSGYKARALAVAPTQERDRRLGARVHREAELEPLARHRDLEA